MPSSRLQILLQTPEAHRDVPQITVYAGSSQVCASKHRTASRTITRSKAVTAMAENMFEGNSDDLPDLPFLPFNPKG